MGWNSLDYVADTHLLQGAYYYFVHSYYCDPSDKNQIAAVSNHGQDFAASIRCDNVLLTQFHPEKSGTAGLRLLKSWIDLEVSGK
jgi:glutamine amidotransferase